MTLTDQATILVNSEGLERVLVGLGVMSILWWLAAAAFTAWLFWVSR